MYMHISVDYVPKAWRVTELKVYLMALDRFESSGL